MTSSVTERHRGTRGNEDEVVVVLDITSYATGGESVTAAILGLEGSQKALITSAIPRETADVIFQHDEANQKLIATVASTGAQVAAMVDLGEVAIRAVSRAGKS